MSISKKFCVFKLDNNFSIKNCNMRNIRVSTNRLKELTRYLLSMARWYPLAWISNYLETGYSSFEIFIRNKKTNRVVDNEATI